MEMNEYLKIIENNISKRININIIQDKEDLYYIRCDLIDMLLERSNFNSNVFKCIMDNKPNIDYNSDTQTLKIFINTDGDIISENDIYNELFDILSKIFIITQL